MRAEAGPVVVAMGPVEEMVASQGGEEGQTQDTGRGNEAGQVALHCLLPTYYSPTAHEVPLLIWLLRVPEPFPGTVFLLLPLSWVPWTVGSVLCAGRTVCVSA